MAATTQAQVGLAGAARGPMLRLDPNALKGALDQPANCRRGCGPSVSSAGAVLVAIRGSARETAPVGVVAPRTVTSCPRTPLQAHAPPCC